MTTIHYRTEDGVIGYREGDVLVNERGERTIVMADGRGLALQPMDSDHASRCDGCGATYTDLDCGFNAGDLDLLHDCGGRWRAGTLYADGSFVPDEPERPPRHAYGHDADDGF